MIKRIICLILVLGLLSTGLGSNHIPPVVLGVLPVEVDLYS